MAEPQFLKTTVVLPVADIHQSVAWYERTLGFQTRYIHGNGKRGEARNFANYAIMACDAIEVHFILDEGGAAWTRAGTGHLGLTVRDVEAVYASVAARGVAASRELRRENWPCAASTWRTRAATTSTLNSRSMRHNGRRHNPPLPWTGPRRVGRLFYSFARSACRVAGHGASYFMPRTGNSALLSEDTRQPECARRAVRRI